VRLTRTVTVSLRPWHWPARAELWDILRENPSLDGAQLAPFESHWSGRIIEVLFWVWSVFINVLLTLWPRQLDGRRGDDPLLVVRWLAWQVVFGDHPLPPPPTIVLPPPPGTYLTEAQLLALAPDPCHDQACPIDGRHACHVPNCEGCKEHRS
jgi:hypothetical protein